MKRMLVPTSCGAAALLVSVNEVTVAGGVTVAVAAISFDGALRFPAAL